MITLPPHGPYQTPANWFAKWTLQSYKFLRTNPFLKVLKTPFKTVDLHIQSK